jgi:hypothetical protein
MRHLINILVACVLPLGFPGTAATEDAADLAQKLSNPVADLISVPYQFNYDNDVGPSNGSRWYMNFQPVVPISLGDNWNLISRTIVPFVANESIVPGTSPSGVGNVLQSFFFSPKQPTRGGMIWGLGPVFSLPTSTDEQFGPDQFAAGITGVALRVDKRWTYGALANQLWNVGGDTDISNLFVQPFVSYTTPTAWSFTLNSESNYNWVDDEASVPINFLVSKLVNLGDQPVSIGGGVRYWADSAPTDPEGFGLRFLVTFLYPK